MTGVAGGLFGMGPQEDGAPGRCGPHHLGHLAWPGMPQEGSSPGAVSLGPRTRGALRCDVTFTPTLI